MERVRLLGLLVALQWTACARDQRPARAAQGSLTTDTDSRTLPDRRQRLDFLARYLRPKSPIADAEFVIHYRDNSGGAIPGPSDWDIRAVIEAEGDAAPWYAGWKPCAGPGVPDGTAATEPAWAPSLLQRRPRWQEPRTTPRCFRDPRSPATRAVVYEQNRLVLYSSSSERGGLSPD